MPASLTAPLLDAALSYPDYRNLVATLARDQRTSGPRQKPVLVELTNHHQQVLDHAYDQPLLPELVERLRTLPRPWRWLVLGETWCGDTSLHLPVLARLAAESRGQVELRVLLRGDNPDVMAAYQTDGKDSIPKLVCLDAATLTELGTWGPRPAAAQSLADELHADKQLPVPELVGRLTTWARADQGRALQHELLPLVEAWRSAEKVA